MVRFKLFAALMTGLAASACANPTPQSTASLAATTSDERQACADSAPTEDSYRYCVEVGLQAAGLEDAGRTDPAGNPSVAALRAE